MKPVEELRALALASVPPGSALTFEEYITNSCGEQCCSPNAYSAHFLSPTNTIYGVELDPYTGEVTDGWSEEA